MKRAKEYAAQYRNEPTDKTLAKIAVAFLAEVAELAKMRHLKKTCGHDALIAILNEQDRKWRTFAESFAHVRPNGFELIFKEKAPETYALWRGPSAKEAKDYFAVTERRRR